MRLAHSTRGSLRKTGHYFQLVPPNTHRSNTAEQAIHTFKEHFISIIAGVAHDFPRKFWDLLLSQTEVALIIIYKETLYPSRSAWPYFHGPFNYDTTPLGSLGCNIIAHKNTGTRNSWDFCGTVGWNVGVAHQHYWCHTVVDKSTKAAQNSDIVEFRHHHLTLPDIPPTDRISTARPH